MRTPAPSTASLFLATILALGSHASALATPAPPSSRASTGLSTALGTPATPAAALKLLRGIAPSFVIVEIRLRQDRGEMPVGITGPGSNIASLAELIDSERPLELPGFLVDERTVVVRDPVLPVRFVESIRVRPGQPSHGPAAAVAATIAASCIESPHLLLAIAEPLAGTAPLRYLPNGASPEGALTSIVARDDEGVWSLTAVPAEERATLESTDSAGGRGVLVSPPDSLAVDGEGRVVRTTLAGRRTVRDEKQPAASGDPRQWPALDERGLRTAEAAIAAQTDRTILRTTLHFRSPRKSHGGDMLGLGGDGAEVATELETLALLLDDGSALVLADLEPSVTARLESIELVSPTGTPVAATFAGSLRDWGAFLATPSSSPKTALRLCNGDLAASRDRLLHGRSIRIVGRDRLSDPMPFRPSAFEIGWRGIRFVSDVIGTDAAFLFTEDGQLAALPLAPRQQPGARDRWNGRTTRCTPAGVVAGALAAVRTDRASVIDPSNQPLSAEDEARTGWLGVLMQPLEPELARANGVADRSRDGEFGGIVTYVYPNSPAAKAGIKAGMILLTITTPRRQQPIEIHLSEFDLGWGGVFPWERLDDLPEEAYDQVPPPWPPIDDTLNSLLTELGIGSTYELAYVEGDQAKRVTLTVEQSPAHYANAPKCEVKSLGLTVRDLTIEVRTYLGLDAEAPGVIVARLEPGQRASVAGLRPFEIIESVDSQPVRSAAEFDAAIRSKSDLKLTVKRAQRERVVKVSLEPGAPR